MTEQEPWQREGCVIVAGEAHDSNGTGEQAEALEVFVGSLI